MDDFKHRLLLGETDDGDVWVDVEWEGGSRLSFSGVIGPKANGDARGSSGQIDSHLGEITTYADGWNAESVAALAALWKRWHLNDMRAGCEHQRAAGWSERRIDESKPSNSYDRHFPTQTSPSWNLLGWVRPEEHPDGLLTRPCPECGYKYGTAWLREDVPETVLAQVAAFPTSTKTYPWRD